MKPIISIITPVYNVSTWLDVCINSIVNQTFTDFELLLIDDGSTDNSGAKCDEWSERDKRIKVFHKKNEGPSIARNYAMSIAQGEYFAFVDSDDWVEETFLEKLYNGIKENDADIAECDIWRYNETTGEKTYKSTYGSLGVDYTREQHMSYGNTAIWKCLFHRGLFVDNNILFPNCHSEAKAIYPLLYAKAKSVMNVREGLYYYRRLRTGSLSGEPMKNRENELKIGIMAFEYLINGFRELGIYNAYREVLTRNIHYKLSEMLIACFSRKSDEEYQERVKSYKEFLRDKFGESGDKTYITFGGYNLNRVTWYMDLLHEPGNRFNFSSIISVVNPSDVAIELTHKNRYRELMVNRDVKSSFWDIVDNNKPECLILDFIEERFDILCNENGYLTKSDAYEGCDNKCTGYEVIERTDSGCMQLWKNSCDVFISRLKESFTNDRVILVKNYLSEMVGNASGQCEYDNIEEIRHMNSILKEYYEYFEQKWQGIYVIEASKMPNYYTDIEYEYGAIPSHLNDIVNIEIAQMIQEVLGI